MGYGRESLLTLPFPYLPNAQTPKRPHAQTQMTMTDTVELFDTTLRDGTQGEHVTLSARDKMRIARRLDAFGIDVIEGGEQCASCRGPRG